MTEPVVTRDTVAAVGTARSWLSTLPKWVQVVLFLAIAAVCAIQDTLDDWVRFGLAILFLALAVTLGTEAVLSLKAHRATEEAVHFGPSGDPDSAR